MWRGCEEEGTQLQRGMNYRLPSGRSVILMSRRTNAPYRDQVVDDGQEPRAAAIRVVREVLAPTLRLRRSLGSVIRGETAQILDLTTEQVQVLELLRNQRRALIAGCAGSGKTVLAVEKARQLSAEGMRVLLLCYNKRLAEQLEQETQDWEQVMAVHFHRLAIGLIRQAEIELDWNTEDPNYWEKTVPEKMVDAIVEDIDRYDAVIVDEGQDFAASWCPPLQWLLSDEKDGIFYVFMDDNQRLYDRPSEIPIDTDTYHAVNESPLRSVVVEEPVSGRAPVRPASLLGVLRARTRAPPGRGTAGPV